MDELIAQIIRKHYPEIAQGWHVPVWAVVTTINENSHEGDLSNAFRPRYAVSVKLLDKQGNETHAPEMPNIAVSGSFSASGGIMQLPEPGAIVELSFAFGDINKPYISTVLPYGTTLASCKPGELITQARKGARMAIDASGNIEQTTDHQLQQISAKLHQIVGHIETHAISKNSEITAHVIENIGGKYQLTALGALMMLTTGHVEIASLESLNLTTASDLNENVAGKKQAIAGELISMQVEKGGKIKIGNETVNTIDILYQLTDVVNQLATALSTHTHPAPDGPTGAPENASEIAGHGSQANALANKVKPLV
ncbi:MULTISPECIES: hypothetical protein [unclassified Vibrio]|uniref:hypothetical protein n=1 Tax=unclassified Vibrio TaxID=2614977 RepID=UPI0013611ADB|nr:MULTISPECIES: hypothetical protein [unclassified Vibrio]NAW59632.1 hypothetical protein [Vibrio sp. V36_P2S2PM302]NAX25028.1 hypothetical protein [Vibrio sp. V38_P2S17PM301]NAX28614.1 hypothetical protein [Vibrio sp. V37_P2S8PM304]